MEYLNELPVIQITIDFVEADDVIAYGARHPYYGGWDKIIVSSDKDFFQLETPPEKRDNEGLFKVFKVQHQRIRTNHQIRQEA